MPDLTVISHTPRPAAAGVLKALGLPDPVALRQQIGVDRVAGEAAVRLDARFGVTQGCG